MLGHRKVVIVVYLLLQHILQGASQSFGRPRPQTMAGGGTSGFAGDALRGGGGFGGNIPEGGFGGNTPGGEGGFGGGGGGFGGDGGRFRGNTHGVGGGGGRPYDSKSAEKDLNVLTEGLNLPLIWKSPIAVQAPALMLLTVVLIMFTTIARDSLSSLLEDKRPIGPSSGAGMRGRPGSPYRREAPEYDNFITPVLDATSHSKFW